MSYLSLHNVHKVYKTGSVPVHALNGVSFDVQKGDLTAITGKSGCGKTTLLNLLGGLDTPTKGSIEVNGKPLSKYRDLSQFRRESVGFVFQFFNLIPILTVEENMCLPLLLNGKRVSQERLDKTIERLGLEKKRRLLPSRLSGGQQQRVAIGRAVLAEPALLLADEPTGNLDSENAEMVVDLLMELNRTAGQTILLVTHDEAIAARCPKRIFLRDGQIVEEAGTGDAR